LSGLVFFYLTVKFKKMIQTLTIPELKEYMSGACSTKRVEEVEIFLAKNPHYIKIMKGLSNLEGTVSINSIEQEMKYKLFK